MISIVKLMRMYEVSITNKLAEITNLLAHIQFKVSLQTNFCNQKHVDRCYAYSKVYINMQSRFIVEIQDINVVG